MNDRSRSPARAVGPYYAGGFGDRDDVEAALDRLSAAAGVAVGELRPVEAFGDAPGSDGAVAVVFAAEMDPAVAGVDRPVVWVAPDPSVAGAAIEAGAADAVAWRPGDDLGLLAAKLDRLATPDDEGASDDGTTPDGEATPDDGETADGGSPVALARGSADGVDDVVHDAALYEYLVKTVGDAVYILDEEGRFTFVNDALCEMTGYERDELLGSSVHRIKDDGTVAEAEDALRRLLREYGESGDDEPSIAELDVELVRKDGRRIPCTDRMTLRPHEDGSFSGTVGTLRDVSRQRRRERILNNLLRATQGMVGEATTEGVAERVVDVAMNTIDAEGAVVREYDPETDELVPVAVPGAVRDRIGERPRSDADEGPVGTAFTENRTVRAENLYHTEAGPDEAGTYLPVGDDRTLSVGHDGDGEFMADARQFLELLAATAGSVFDRVEQDQERRRYRAAVEAADDMLFTLDDAGEFTLVTGPLASALGTTRAALVGTPVGNVLPEETDAADLLDPPADGAVTETELIARDGEAIPTRIAASPIEGAAADGVVASVEEIRELRMARAEASRQRRRFAELFGTLTDPLVELSFEEGEATVSAANDRFVDLTDADGATLSDAPLSAVRDALPEAVADALAAVRGADAAVEREVTVGTARGLRHYLLRSVPYRDDGVDRAFVVLTDVTEVKQQGTHLRVLHRLLRHNLRNRTNVILGRAGLVRAATDSEAVADHAARIEEASEALVDTSETAQAIQRTLRDRGSGADPEVLSASAVADRLDRLAESVTPETTVRVETDGPVPYDGAVHRAVTELLDNAVEFGTPDPESTVVIRVLDHDDGTVRIAVADEGPGIPDSEWSVVAGDREITQLQHASGLGLWLVKWVADMHGGELRLLSTGEDGTTVALDLPVG